MSEGTWIVAAGKEQGEIVARHLMCRMRERSITPMEAVSFVAALVENQAEEMISAGTSQEAVLLWFGSFQETVMEKLLQLARQN